MRSRNVRINTDILKTNDHSSISLNLFDDVVLQANLVRIERSKNGNYIWVGKLEGDDKSEVVLVTNGEITTGSIRSLNHEFSIKFAGNGIHAVMEMDKTGYSKEAPGIVPDVVFSEHDSPPPLSPDSGSEATVTFVYTQAAVNYMGGLAAIKAEIDLAITLANEAFTNSNIAFRYSLAHDALVSYSEANFNWYTTLDRLTYKNDGYLENVHTLRDQYGADLVTMLIGTGSPYWGLGWVMQYNSTSF